MWFSLTCHIQYLWMMKMEIHDRGWLWRSLITIRRTAGLSLDQFVFTGGVNVCIHDWGVGLFSVQIYVTFEFRSNVSAPHSFSWTGLFLNTIPRMLDLDVEFSRYVECQAFWSSVMPNLFGPIVILYCITRADRLFSFFATPWLLLIRLEFSHALFTQNAPKITFFFVCLHLLLFLLFFFVGNTSCAFL